MSSSLEVPALLAGSGRIAGPVLLATIAALLPSREIAAGGPLLVGKDGTPRRWATSSSVKLSPDQGRLGRLTNPRELIQHAIVQWDSVSTSKLNLSFGEDLPLDISTEAEFEEWMVKNDGLNPLIYDADGSIFEDLFGGGSAVIGVAGPSLITSKGTIIKGFAMFNGREVADDDIELVRAAFTHEIGHLLNLDHTQINGLPFYTECGSTPTAVPGFQGNISVQDVETMFPVLVNAPGSPHPMATLHKDDEAAISVLYPTTNFASSRAAILGRVVDFDGDTPIQGVNVVARSLEAPFDEAFSFVSGGFFLPRGSSLPEAERGVFELRGLTPGRTYKVYAEEVARCFTAGARLGPLDPPLDLDPEDGAAFLELWSGPRESADDDPLDGEPIALGDGDTREIRIILNGVRARVTGIEPDSGNYSSPREVTVRGANFTGAVSVRLTPGTFNLTGVSVQSSAVLRATVPAGIIPDTYIVTVTTPKGTSEDEDVTYRVTEPPPAVSETVPDSIENDADREITVIGTNLLGARSAVLIRDGSPPIEAAVRRVTSASAIEIEVPAGLPPGSYRVTVTNTAGTSPPSAVPLLVLELAPLLRGEVVPPSASTSGARKVRILGENLSGTTMVELVSGNDSFTLAVVSASFNEVVVSVPGGIEPGTYLVRITNSEGATTGPTVFTVKKSSGGGGGCGSIAFSPGRGQPDLPLLLLVLAAILAWKARRRAALARSGCSA